MKPDVLKAALAERIKPGIRPEVMLIDLDKGFFSNRLHPYDSDQQALDNALHYVLDRINEKFHGRFCSTVLWTGNGYHIYLPVQLSGPSWCPGHNGCVHGSIKDH
jgi:hypothetical protein